MSASWPPQSQGKSKKHGGKFSSPPLIKQEQIVSAEQCTVADCIDKATLKKLEQIRMKGK